MLYDFGIGINFWVESNVIKKLLEVLEIGFRVHLWNSAIVYLVNNVIVRG